MTRLLLTITAIFAGVWIVPPPQPTFEEVNLNYLVPEVSEDLRKPDDCAQFAIYTVITNMGCDVDEAAFIRLMKAKHENGGTKVSDLPKQLWPWIPSAYHKTGSTTDLHSQLAAGRPAILITMWPQENRPAFGHGMVLSGKTDEGWILIDDRGSFTVSDDFFNTIWLGQWIEVGGKLDGRTPNTL